MTSPSKNRLDLAIRQSSTPSLLECIQMRNWQKAIDLIASDHKLVYEQGCQNNGRMIGIHHSHNSNNNDVHTGHLAIHELCRMTTSPTSVRFSKDEISDDEEDDDDDDDESNDTAGELDQIFDACELEEGTKMYEVTQFMIDVSHSMGPVKVAVPPSDDDENDTANDVNNELGPIEERQNDVERNQPENEVEEERNRNRNRPHPSDQSENDESSGFAVHKSILTYADSTGKTPLHILCENSCDSSMMKVILGSTREATGNPQAPTAMSLILAKDSRGSTPLHYLAYSRQCPFSSLKLMMEYCKPRFSDSENGERTWIDPTLCTDHDGETPLHWALAGYVSSRRIKELTRLSVDAIMVENEKGEKPFDQFTTNFVDSDWTDHDVCGHEVWENIQEYLRCIQDNQFNNHHTKSARSSSDPQRMNECDSNDGETRSSKWLPLHFLAGAKHDFPPIFTDLALKYCSDDLQKADANGMLPLHLVCARKSAAKNVLGDSSSSSSSIPARKADALAMKILKKFQRASLIPAGSTKRLPLHFAVETHKPPSLIAALIRTYPRSLNIPDPATKLWPYVLAGVKQNDCDHDEATENESLSVSFALLRADPSVLHLVRKNYRVSNLTDKERSRFAAERRKENEASRTESYMEHSSRRIRRLTIRDARLI